MRVAQVEVGGGGVDDGLKKLRRGPGEGGGTAGLSGGLPG
jgi:hypothetical protein